MRFDSRWLAIFKPLLALALAAAGAMARGVGAAADEPPPMEERVYLTVDQALRETFPRAGSFRAEERILSGEQKARIEARVGGPVASDSVTVHVALDTLGGMIGYAVVSEEIGKYRPITFMVGATPGLKVERVSVLVYRESHGGEIRRARFLNQYRGKTYGSPIRINRDIINISGATLSVRSLNHGVRKVLGILNELYGPAPARKEAP